MTRLVTPQELKELVDKIPATEGDRIDVIDVREPSEWASGHIAGARLVPLDTFKADVAGAAPRDNVAFICARGGRSAAAAQLAEAAGKKTVYSLDGGTLAWIAAGLPIVVPKPGAAPELAANPSAEAEVADPALDAIVGQNLKELRAARGLSLDDLAREAGISRTTLGQIELGRSAPSISVVWKIAQTLGVPFSTLLSTAPHGGTTISHRARAKRLTSADGRFSSRALFPLGDGDAAEFYELWLAPHSVEDAEPHRPGTRENLIVTAGRLELKFGREVVLLQAGDAVMFNADVPHSYRNPDTEDCWMYLVMNYAARP